MCGSKPINLEMVANNSDSGRINLQIIGGGHGCNGHKENHDEHEEENYHECQDYGSMNPAYILESPFMSSEYSAANNGDYSPIKNYSADYSQKENSSYKAA